MRDVSAPIKLPSADLDDIEQMLAIPGVDIQPTTLDRHHPIDNGAVYARVAQSKSTCLFLTPCSSFFLILGNPIKSLLCENRLMSTCLTIVMAMRYRAQIGPSLGEIALQEDEFRRQQFL